MLINIKYRSRSNGWYVKVCCFLWPNMQINNEKKKIAVFVLAVVFILFFINGAPGQDGSSGLENLDTGKDDKPAGPSQAVPSGRLIVSFIDVGQGDAILVQTPGKNILIDGGERGNTVIDYLKKRGIGSLDLVVGTHPHADHIGGLINVMQSIPVKEVIDPGVVHTTKTFEDYLTLIDQEEIVFTEGRAGMTRDLGDGVIMKILHPSSPSTDINESSIVVKITFGQVSFMLTGDVGQDSEMKILQRGYDLKSTILKVAHHGSIKGTSSSFLSAVRPTVAVIMCGKENPYGYPHDETLTKLAGAKVDIYRTDIQGTIVIITDGETFKIN